MATLRCLLCETRVWLRFVLCPEHRAEYGEYNTWPEWLLYLARQEKARRWRDVNKSKEYSDSSLDAILEAQRADGHEDNTWVWLGYVGDGMEKLLEVRMEAIEVLATLETDELAILLLTQMHFTFVEIGEIMGIGRDRAWKRWASAKKRLRLAATESGP